MNQQLDMRSEWLASFTRDLAVRDWLPERPHFWGSLGTQAQEGSGLGVATRGGPDMNRRSVRQL